MRCQMIAVLVLLAAPPLCHDGLTRVLAEEESDVIEIMPKEARGYLGRQVRVLMTVKSAKYSVHRKCVFLDSEEDFRDEKNLGVVIEESALKELAEEAIDKPQDIFKRMELKLTGKLELREGRPYLVVKKTSQIRIVRP